MVYAFGVAICMGNHFKRKGYVLVFVTGILHTFGNKNNNRRMSCIRVGIRIGNGIIIIFSFYIIL